MILKGNLDSATEHATRAQEYAEALGGIYPQAQALYIQARCQIISANYSEAQILLKKSTQLLISCGLEGYALNLQLQGWAAEVHLLKTEYLKSHQIQTSITATSKPISYDSLLANLNVALIDIACGIDSECIRKNLDQCQLRIAALYGLPKTFLELLTNRGLAELCLRDGDLKTANIIFTRCFVSSQNCTMEMTTACLERLADLSVQMNNMQTTVGWAGIFLVIALKLKDKLAIMKAFHCLGQIFDVEGDSDTALNLFNVALDGFTFMDVHQWRANCMVQMGDIWKGRGEFLRAVGLWKGARPLFARSSQVRDVARIDVKLATVDVAILERYEGQLLQLTKLNVPTGVLTAADLENPTSEKED
ncbi:hypothetical protein C8J57DRAFT_1482163 [Mycena rebaudengoi]|nr:hypothetical protein C8J57DRAFT_1482163 [Mycena rebaudengoi]